MTDAPDTILAALRQDIQAYRGALGYPVSGECSEFLSDNSLPRCGFCDAKNQRIKAAEATLARVQAENETLRAALEQIRDMFEMTLVDYRTIYQDHLTINGRQTALELVAAALAPQPPTPQEETR